MPNDYINDLDDYFNTDINQDDFVPEKGIRRLKGKETVSIDGKMYWAPEALLDDYEKLQTIITKMQTDTAIMHAVHNSSMSEDERAAITYQSGPYDITKLTVGIRDFVKVLIKQTTTIAEL